MSELPYSAASSHLRTAFESEKLLSGHIDASNDSTTSQSPHTFSAWIHTTWALIAHFIFSIGTVAFVLFYVNDKTFNLEERSPSVTTTSGHTTGSFRPTQSDIVTALSGILEAIRFTLAAWVTPLFWRVALFLMEREGLPRRDLKTLLAYGVLRPTFYKRNAATFLIGTFLLASILSGFVSPLLTGSIYWSPSSQLVNNSDPTIGPAKVSHRCFSARWESYQRNEASRLVIVQRAAGMVGLAWGRDVDRGIFRRVVPSLDQLAINSTVENVTLPYFAVHNLEWISKPYESLGKHERSIETIHHKMSKLSPLGIAFSTGAVLMTHRTNWTNSNDSKAIHSNEKITDTRTLVLYHGFNTTAVDKSQPISSISSGLPPNMGILIEGGKIYSLARVTFSAGVGQCRQHNCLVSSLSTVQNSTPIELQPDHLTIQSLALAPLVAQLILNGNTSVPLPINGSRINDYVEAVLVRSYAGAWNALNDFTGEWSPPLFSRYIPAWEGLRAQVDKRRLYAWLAIQLMVTFLGAIFLLIQSRSKHPLIGNTVLAAFYLDTTTVPRSGDDPAFKRGSVLRSEKVNGRYQVKVDA